MTVPWQLLLAMDDMREMHKDAYRNAINTSGPSLLIS
jgi:hypothetical protein